MMKIPKYITVLGEKYRVKVIKGLSEDQGLDGLCDPHSFTILLDASLLRHPRALKRTFYHEVGHAFAFECGLSEFMSAAALEMFCQSFGSFVCSLS